MLRRELVQTPAETFHTALSIIFRLVRHGLRLPCFVQRQGLPGAIPTHLEQEHSRDANAIGAEVTDDLSVANLSRAPVDGLVSIVFRCRAAAPFEETDEVAANLEIAIGRDVAIGSKRRQQPVVLRAMVYRPEIVPVAYRPAPAPIARAAGAEPDDPTRMPDLRGESAREAAIALARRGLVVVLKGSGRVAAQEPESGTEIEAGATCVLTLSHDGTMPAPAQTPRPVLANREAATPRLAEARGAGTEAQP